MRNLLLLFLLLHNSFSLKAEWLNTDQGLSKQQESLIAISAYGARGDLDNLRIALNNGLDHGLSINTIKESLIHMYAYAGFPRSIRGLQTLMAVLTDREKAGKEDKEGMQASVIMDERTKYERGKAILQELTGVPENDVKTGYARFAPTIEVFLKEHLFADLFERDVLTYEERELVTISVLSSITKVEPMLKSHLIICLNLGFTAKQLQEYIMVLRNTIGKEDAGKAENVLIEVLKK